jgi:RNA-directed DNA polymerase
MSILSSLSKSLSMSTSELYRYINTAPHRYKTYDIPKRNGKGFRKIAQPTPAIKIIQREVIEKIINGLPFHESCTAYVKKKSIKDNAELHMENSYLLKMDFKDFFPSITPSDLMQHCKKYYENLDETDEFVIPKLFFWKPKGATLRLSIGAPSSPFISNTVMYDFDCLIFEKAKSMGITYSRYADDLTFTTNQQGILFGIPELVKNILLEIDYPKLKINEEKTIFSSKANNRHITGIVITNEGKISLGRDRKRKIKSFVFKCKNGNLNEYEMEYLKGNIAFAKSIEPDFFQSLVKKFGDYVISEICAHQKGEKLFN